MKQEVGEGKELKVEYLLVDLASFASVKDFVKTFKEKNLPLHILINNAGIAWVPYSKLQNLCVSFVPRSRLSKKGLVTVCIWTLSLVWPVLRVHADTAVY